MEKVLFVGAEKRETKDKSKTYYMVYAGHIINENNGIGASPMSFKVSYDKYKELVNAMDIGTEFEIEYEFAYDANGRPKFILMNYKI